MLLSNYKNIAIVLLKIRACTLNVEMLYLLCDTIHRIICGIIWKYFITMCDQKLLPHFFIILINFIYFLDITCYLGEQ
jgi:hypothetical protein